MWTSRRILALAVAVAVSTAGIAAGCGFSGEGSLETASEGGAECSDLVKNGSETDVDCGGSCATKCGDAKRCATAADCASGVCTALTCTPTAGGCSNGVKDGTESDVDCGGACSAKCAEGKACAVAADCVSGSICSANRCAAPKSCREMKVAVPASVDGTYTIDLDGPGGAPPSTVYCDMTFDDGSAAGGWTLIESIQVPNGPTKGLTEGAPLPGTSIYMRVAEVKALAAISTQVHIRTPGLATTQSVTSIPNAAPILHLRAGVMVDVGVDTIPEHALWTGPYADASHLDFSCANANAAWPNVYQACGTDGMHIWLQHARWNWSGGNASLNTAFEIYTR